MSATDEHRTPLLATDAVTSLNSLLLDLIPLISNHHERDKLKALSSAVFTKTSARTFMGGRDDHALLKILQAHMDDTLNQRRTMLRKATAVSTQGDEHFSTAEQATVHALLAELPGPETVAAPTTPRAAYVLIKTRLGIAETGYVAYATFPAALFRSLIEKCIHDSELVATSIRDLSDKFTKEKYGKDRYTIERVLQLYIQSMIACTATREDDAELAPLDKQARKIDTPTYNQSGDSPHTGMGTIQQSLINFTATIAARSKDAELEEKIKRLLNGFQQFMLQYGIQNGRVSQREEDKVIQKRLAAEIAELRRLAPASGGGGGGNQPGEQGVPSSSDSSSGTDDDESDENQTAAAEAQVAEAEARAAAAAEQVTAAKAQAAEATTRAKTAEAQAAEATTRAETAEAHAAAAAEQVTAAKAQAAAAAEQATAAEAQVDTLTGENRGLQEEVTRLQGIIDGYITQRKFTANQTEGDDSWRSHKKHWYGIFNAGNKVDAAEAFKDYLNEKTDGNFTALQPHLRALKEGDLLNRAALALRGNADNWSGDAEAPDGGSDSHIINSWVRNERAHWRAQPQAELSA
jgi:hypothetical protein